MMINKMATTYAESQERFKLYKFTKILTLKVAQIVVQSRQGKKITHEYAASKTQENGQPSSPNNLQWVQSNYNTHPYFAP